MRPEPDEPLLTDADRRQLAAIDAERNPLTRAELARAYYRDADRVRRTPRETIARHVAVLGGMVAGLALTLIDPTTDANLTAADRELLAGIETLKAEAAINPRYLAPLVTLIREYWRDADRAARTSRATLFLHMGLVHAAFEQRDRDARTLEAQVFATAGKVLEYIDQAAAGLCGEPAPTRVEGFPTGVERYRCTREAGHEGEHVAGVGPWRPGDHELARWARSRVQ